MDINHITFCKLYPIFNFQHFRYHYPKLHIFSLWVVRIKTLKPRHLSDAFLLESNLCLSIERRGLRHCVKPTVLYPSNSRPHLIFFLVKHVNLSSPSYRELKFITLAFNNEFKLFEAIYFTSNALN